MKPYKGPKYFFGSWLSLGKFLSILHINNEAYERDMTDILRYSIEWDVPREAGEALLMIFELRLSKFKSQLTDRNLLEFSINLGPWHFSCSPYYRAYNIFGKSKYESREVKK